MQALAFAPDVNLLALAQQDCPVTVRDLATNTVRRTFAEDSSRCNFLAFSPDGSLLAMRCFPKQGQRTESATLQVHELATGKLQASFPGAQSTPLPMLFSANSKMLAAVDENRDLQIWDIAGQKVLDKVRMRKGRVLGLWLSRDGQELRSANENGLIISWRLPGVKAVAHRQFTYYQGENECGAFSPDGKLFATGARGGSIQLWNTATGKLRATMHGHRGRVQSLAFTPDGTRLASGSRDETAKLWDVTSAKELATLQIQSHAKAVCFAPDGKTLAIGGGDGNVKLWKVDQTP